MKRTFRCAALAAAFSLGLAGTASAVPIHFDFTGTITGVEGVEGVAVGAAISGGFTFETDRLVGTHRAGDPQYSWLDLEPVGLTEPYAFLNFGGRELAYPSAASGNYAVINFFDACRPDCGPLGPENFGMYASTGHSAAPDFTGIIQHSAFYFASAALTRLPDPPFIETFDYFDGAQVDPTSIVTLPLYDMVGFYSGGTMDCVLGACVNTDSGSLGFSIDSVTRGIGARAVPEPGTLGLLAVGLAGLLLFRRRAPAWWASSAC
jgi:hypothetical protein